jgi:uncharacterized membrane protein
MTNFIMELSQYIGGMAVSLSYCQSVVQIFASNPSIPVCSSLCELALPSILQISGSSLTESKVCFLFCYCCIVIPEFVHFHVASVHSKSNSIEFCHRC